MQSTIRNYDVKSRTLDVKLLKAKHKLAKIPTSAIVEAERKERRPINADYVEAFRKR